MGEALELRLKPHAFCESLPAHKADNLLGLGLQLGRSDQPPFLSPIGAIAKGHKRQKRADCAVLDDGLQQPFAIHNPASINGYSRWQKASRAAAGMAVRDSFGFKIPFLFSTEGEGQHGARAAVRLAYIGMALFALAIVLHFLPSP